MSVILRHLQKIAHSLGLLMSYELMLIPVLGYFQSQFLSTFVSINGRRRLNKLPDTSLFAR
jgi:hypothetical protein